MLYLEEAMGRRNKDQQMRSAEDGYRPPGAANDPTNGVLVMNHSDSACSIKIAVMESLADPDSKVGESLQ